MKELDPRVSEIVNMFVRFSAQGLSPTVSREDVEAIVRDVLFGSRKLSPALDAGIVTSEEVAGALGAHVHSRAFERMAGPALDVQGKEWSDVIAEVARLLASDQ